MKLIKSIKNQLVQATEFFFLYMQSIVFLYSRIQSAANYIRIYFSLNYFNPALAICLAIIN